MAVQHVRAPVAQVCQRCGTAIRRRSHIMSRAQVVTCRIQWVTACQDAGHMRVVSHLETRRCRGAQPT